MQLPLSYCVFVGQYKRNPTLQAWLATTSRHNASSNSLTPWQVLLQGVLEGEEARRPPCSGQQGPWGRPLPPLLRPHALAPGQPSAAGAQSGGSGLLGSWSADAGRGRRARYMVGFEQWHILFAGQRHAKAGHGGSVILQDHRQAWGSVCRCTAGKAKALQSLTVAGWVTP